MGDKGSGRDSMKVLVTGARSLLGAAVARDVVQRGHDCVVVQRNPAGIPGVAEFLDDISDPRQIDTWMRGVDTVIHLAAKVGIAGAPEDFERINVGGTRRLLEAAQRHGVGAFIFASSPSVAHAGRPLMGVGAEPADPGSARGSYSRTKAIAELDVLSANSLNFVTLALRPHLVWGPGDTQLIGRIVARAQSKRLFLIGNGQALIDTCVVDNAASAFGQAIEHGAEAGGEALMVTNGEPRTVKEILERICRAAGVPLPRIAIPRGLAMAVGRGVESVWGDREEDPPLTSFLVEQLSTAHWFDIRQTRQLLRWEPATSLDQGFASLARYYSQQVQLPN